MIVDWLVSVKMTEFIIKTLGDNGTGIKTDDIEDFMMCLRSMVSNCIANGATYIEVDIDSDSSYTVPTFDFRREAARD